MSIASVMTAAERAAIAGRFTEISETPFVVGFIGNVWPADLSPAQLDYIKRFYCRVDYDHEILYDFPVPANRSGLNGFIKLTPTDDIKRGHRWLIEKLDDDVYITTYQEYYHCSGWRTIGGAERCSRDYVVNVLGVPVE